jgi:hypothetical protein
MSLFLPIKTDNCYYIPRSDYPYEQIYDEKIFDKTKEVLGVYFLAMLQEETADNINQTIRIRKKDSLRLKKTKKRKTLLKKKLF